MVARAGVCARRRGVHTVWGYATLEGLDGDELMRGRSFAMVQYSGRRVVCSIRRHGTLCSILWAASRLRAGRDEVRTWPKTVWIGELTTRETKVWVDVGILVLSRYDGVGS